MFPAPERALASRGRRDWIILAIFGAVVVAVIIVGATSDWFSLRKLGDLLARIRDARGTGVVFTALFIGVAAVGLPITPLILISSVLFGVWIGGLISWGAAVVGSVLGYYLARALGRNALRRIIERVANRKLDFSGSKARRTVLRLRLIPLTPFGALTFAAGIAGMRLRDFVVATAVGIIPSVALLTYFGGRVLSGGRHERHTAVVQTMVVAAVLALLSFAPTIWDRMTGWKEEAS